LPLAHSAKALRAKSETQSWWGCVSSDLSLLFFIKLFSTFFPAFLTLLRLTELGFGIGLSYKNSTLTTVTIYILLGI
jgi:hypothetical protein